MRARPSFAPNGAPRLLALVWLSGCANLPAVERGQCGNAIVELGEDCDTFERGDGSHCLPAGEDGACHFTCAVGSSGLPTPCPADRACDFDGLCRWPTGTFAAPVKYSVGGVTSLAAGDFDGDGRHDVLSRNPRDLAGRATLSFHYFDARAALVETRSFRRLTVAPAIGTLSNDARSDVAFSDFRLGALLGSADRSVVPEAFTPYLLPRGVVRLTGAREGRVGNAAALATLGILSMGPGIYVPDQYTSTIALNAPVSSPLELLLGDPAGADIIEGPSSPCAELVLAFRGETALQMFDLCAPELPNGDLVWAVSATAIRVPLEPPAALDAAPLTADLNGDGHLDVLVGAGGLSYAAYGNGQGLSTASPYQPAVEDPRDLAPGFTMPLAVGELSGDNAPDFVLSDRILLSAYPSATALPRGAGEP